MVTTRSVFIWVNSFWVDSSAFKERAVLACMAACQEVAAILQSKYGYKFDILHPEFVTIAQYALPDVFTGNGDKVRFWFNKGNIDYSRGFRELEYSNAKSLSDFLDMHERLARIEESLKKRLRER